MPNMELLTSKSDACNLGEEDLVEVLVDPTTRQWNRSLIYSIFNQPEALKIVSIPLSQSLPKDKICWHWEKNGCYTVPSAYHLLSKIRENLQPGPVPPQERETMEGNLEDINSQQGEELHVVLGKEHPPN